MQYVKKMCILRQVKQGFSGDGKSLSGLIKVEQYGKNLAVEVSAINFAPLVSGEYYCILSDARGRAEMLPLRGKSMFNLLSDMEIAQGFCGVICYVKNDVVPVAYGVNGDGVYDWKKIVQGVVKSTLKRPTEEQTATADDERTARGYDDEKISAENYYAREEGGRKNEREPFYQADDDAYAQSAAEKQDEKTRSVATENEHADGVLRPFATEGDGYYLSVKHEIDELMRKYPRDERLQGAFSCSEWVKINDRTGKEYLVGVVYADGRAKYVCYAVAAEGRTPPKEIADACTFVPVSPYDDEQGFFVIFQSAATGECIRPQKA